MKFVEPHDKCLHKRKITELEQKLRELTLRVDMMNATLETLKNLLREGR